MRERKGGKEGKREKERGRGRETQRERAERRLCPLNPDNPPARTDAGKMVRTRS